MVHAPPIGHLSCGVLQPAARVPHSRHTQLSPPPSPPASPPPEAGGGFPACEAVEQALSTALQHALSSSGEAEATTILSALSSAVQTQLLEEGEAAAEALQQQAEAEGMFTLGCGTVHDAARGLEQLIGAPDEVDLYAAMEREHHSSDADIPFEAVTYGVVTTSRTEWKYVVEPETGLAALQLEQWPAETKLHADDPKRRGPPRSLREQTRVREEINRRLESALSPAALTREEQVAAMLYTGPIGLKYQKALRAVAVADRPGQEFRRDFLVRHCRGNTYGNTIHLIHSALHKLSVLVAPSVVYCGIADGMLPPWCRRGAQRTHGTRGALEFGFISCTPSRSVALDYARAKLAMATILELKMGALDRGGDLRLLSQYPHEQEVCLPPTTFYEIDAMRVDAANPSLLVVSARVRVPRPAVRPPLLDERSRAALARAAATYAAGDSAKFCGDVAQLVTGEIAQAASGLAQHMQVGEAELQAAMSRGVAAIEEEVARAGIAELSAHLHYVLYERATEETFPNGVRDKGRRGEALADFVAHAVARQCHLSEAHCCAIRLYTTAAYVYINGPLRAGNGKPHPLPVTVAFLAEGLKKLRAQRATDAEQATRANVLWRGMRHLEIDDAFLKDRRGGTELASMSTTKDINVAASYACSSRSLLFKVVASNFMQWGADLEWISAFPSEAEICYPPLTYIQPTGRLEKVNIGDVEYTVVEVHPHIS